LTATSVGGATAEVFPKSYTSFKSALAGEPNLKTVFLVKNTQGSNGVGIDIVLRSELANHFRDKKATESERRPPIRFSFSRSLQHTPSRHIIATLCSAHIPMSTHGSRLLWPLRPSGAAHM
jgi:hypothetical protein